MSIVIEKSLNTIKNIELLYHLYTRGCDCCVDSSQLCRNKHMILCMYLFVLQHSVLHCLYIHIHSLFMCVVCIIVMSENIVELFSEQYNVQNLHLVTNAHCTKNSLYTIYKLSMTKILLQLCDFVHIFS